MSSSCGANSSGRRTVADGRNSIGKSALACSWSNSPRIRTTSARTSSSVWIPPQLRNLSAGTLGFGISKDRLDYRRRFGGGSSSAAVTADQEIPVSAVPSNPSPPVVARNSRRVVPAGVAAAEWPQGQQLVRMGSLESKSSGLIVPLRSWEVYWYMADRFVLAAVMLTVYGADCHAHAAAEVSAAAGWHWLSERRGGTGSAQDLLHAQQHQPRAGASGRGCHWLSEHKTLLKCATNTNRERSQWAARVGGVAPYAGNRNSGCCCLSSFAALICCLDASVIFGAPMRLAFLLAGIVAARFRARSLVVVEHSDRVSCAQDFPPDFPGERGIREACLERP